MQKWHVKCHERALDGGAGEAGEGKDRGVLRVAGGEGENAERCERESDLEKNGMEEPLEEAAQNARRIYRGGNKLNEFAP